MLFERFVHIYTVGWVIFVVVLFETKNSAKIYRVNCVQFLVGWKGGGGQILTLTKYQLTDPLPPSVTLVAKRETHVPDDVLREPFVIRSGID